MNTPERNRQKIFELFEFVLNGGRDELLDDLIADDYIENKPFPGQAPGPEGIKDKLKGIRSAFPDIRFFLEATESEGNPVAVRYHWEATNSGSFMGVPPTGEWVTVRGMDFYRFENGRIAEHWDSIDRLGLMQQLGIKG